MRMSSLALCLAAGLSLSACGNLQEVEDLTVGDGFKYVDENHTTRRHLRQRARTIDDIAMDKCEQQLREAAEDYLTVARACKDYIHEVYPGLATYEAIKEGVDYFQELEGKIDNPPAKAVAR